MGIFAWRVFVRVITARGNFTSQNIWHCPRRQWLFRMKKPAVASGVCNIGSRQNRYRQKENFYP